MICKKCGSECPDGNIFCEACGAELDAPVLPENIDAKGRVKKKKDKKAKEPAPEKAKRTPEEKAAAVKRIKRAGAILLILAIIAAAVAIAVMAGDSKGYNAAQNIPLGRNVEYASSETGLVFTEESPNAMLAAMSDFDYICISEDTVKVSGSEQPRWAILLTVGEDDMITDVEYYDFNQLKLNWKGRKMAQLLTKDSLEYGMSIRSVNSTLGLKPYYIKRSVSNDSVYCYRYYFTDAESGCDRTFNYYVEFSDVELSVRNIHYSEVNYARAILNASFDPVYAGRDTATVTETEPVEGETSETSETDAADETGE